MLCWRETTDGFRVHDGCLNPANPGAIPLESEMNEITHLLNAIEQGDRYASDELLPLVYDELRRLAAQKLAPNHQARHSSPPPWSTRPTSGWSGPMPTCVGTAVGISSRPQRKRCADFSSRERVRKSRDRHGGDRQRVDLDERHLSMTKTPDRLLAVDESLTRLAERSRGGRGGQTSFLRGLHAGTGGRISRRVSRNRLSTLVLRESLASLRHRGRQANRTGMIFFGIS